MNPLELGTTMCRQTSTLSSYHFAINSGATTSLTFVGTGAWAFGARRTISGPYSVQVDNLPAQNFDGPPARADVVFQSLLGGANGLAYGEHTIVVTNLSEDPKAPVLDIDAFLVETTGQRPTLVDDVDQQNRIQYSSAAGDWATESTVAVDGAEFTAGTVHESRQNGASVSFSFDGTGVQVTGAVGPDNGRYSVQLDGVDAGQFEGQAVDFHAGASLFVADNLPNGPHTVTLTNTGTGNDALVLDSFQIFDNGSASPNAPPVEETKPNEAVSEPVTTAPAPSGPNIGLIVGLVIGGLVLLGLLIFGIFFLRRMKSRNKDEGPATVNSFTSGGPRPLPPAIIAPPAGPSLSRENSRASAATLVVDLEQGGAGVDDKEKQDGWLTSITRKATFKGAKMAEPQTPPLPMQAAPGPSPLSPAVNAAPFGSQGSGIPSSSRSPPALSMMQQIAPTPILLAVPKAALRNKSSSGSLNARSADDAFKAPSRAITPPGQLQQQQQQQQQAMMSLHPFDSNSSVASVAHLRSGSVGSIHGAGITATGVRAPTHAAGSSYDSNDSNSLARSRSLTSHEIMRARSQKNGKKVAAPAVSEQRDSKDSLVPPRPVMTARESTMSFDLSAYTDPETPAPPVPPMPPMPSMLSQPKIVVESGDMAPTPAMPQLGSRPAYARVDAYENGGGDRGSGYSSSSSNGGSIDLGRGRAFDANGEPASTRARSRSRARPGMI